MQRRSKYNAKKIKFENYTFDSKAECLRYIILKSQEFENTIKNLKVHPVFELVVNGQKICKYYADFSYTKSSKEIIEDVKGLKTQVYNIKKRLMFACLGIKIVEIPVRRSKAKGRRSKAKGIGKKIRG